jgi:carboxymethylenebutenolidase
VNQAGDDQVDADVRATTDWIKQQPFSKRGADRHHRILLGRAGRVALGDDQSGYQGGRRLVWPAQEDGARAGELKAPVLGFYGGKDQGITQEDVAAMRAALAAGRKEGRPHRLSRSPARLFGRLSCQL